MGENLWNVVCVEKQVLVLRRDDFYGLDSIGGKIEIIINEDNLFFVEKNYKIYY